MNVGLHPSTQRSSDNEHLGNGPQVETFLKKTDLWGFFTVSNIVRGSHFPSVSMMLCSSKFSNSSKVYLQKRTSSFFAGNLEARDQFGFTFFFFEQNTRKFLLTCCACFVVKSSFDFRFFWHRRWSLSWLLGKWFLRGLHLIQCSRLFASVSFKDICMPVRQAQRRRAHGSLGAQQCSSWHGTHVMIWHCRDRKRCMTFRAYYDNGRSHANFQS